jgi:hypothetical protein
MLRTMTPSIPVETCVEWGRATRRVWQITDPATPDAVLDHAAGS